MRLQHGLHLAYCTNIHRGESWEETFQNLKQHTLAVRQKVAPDEPYAIGLRLGQEAAKDLSQPQNLTAFKTWLEKTTATFSRSTDFHLANFMARVSRRMSIAPIGRRKKD